jgi:hypothetical protein
VRRPRPWQNPRVKKTCPRCGKRVGNNAARCRGCGYRFPERSGPRPAGLALGVGFPLFFTGVLILFIQDTSGPLKWGAAAMILVGALMFFDPR